MELVDCAFPLLAGLDLHDDPNDAFDGVEHRAARRARVRAPRAWSAPSCSRRTARSSPPRARRSARARPSDVKVLVVGNPANTNCLIAMNNARDVPRERFTVDDAPRPQPRDRPAREQGRRAGHRRHARWASGATTRRRMYPDLFHAEVRRRAAGRRGRRHGLDRERVHPERRQARRRDHRGARRVLGRVRGQRRDRPRARLGRGHGRRLGLDGRPLRRLLRRSPRASSAASPASAAAAAGRSSRASTSTSSRAPRSTRPWPSSRASATPSPSRA